MSFLSEDKYIQSGYPDTIYIRVSVVLFFIIILINRLFAGILLLPEKLTKGSREGTGTEGLMVVKIAYNNDFSYSKNYENRSIEGCYKFHLTEHNIVLRCREYISIIRPGVVLKKWLELQRKKKYFIFSLNEFGILNAKSEIVSVQPASWFVKELMRVKNGNSIVSGVFIRHTTDVRKYGFMREGNTEITYINATKNHPFYVRNRGGFIPVGTISAADLLMNEDGKPFLLQSRNDLKEDRKLNTHIPRIVYNIELHSKHTYFVGKQKIFVHNSCAHSEYFYHLCKRGLVYKNSDGRYLRLRVSKNDLFLLAKDTGEENKFAIKPKNIPNSVTARLRIMGWQKISPREENGINLHLYNEWRLGIDLSYDDYMEFLPFFSRTYRSNFDTSKEYLLFIQEVYSCSLSRQNMGTFPTVKGSLISAKQSLSRTTNLPFSASLPLSANLPPDDYNILSIESYGLPPRENLPFLDVLFLDYNELRPESDTLDLQKTILFYK